MSKLLEIKIPNFECSVSSEKFEKSIDFKLTGLSLSVMIGLPPSQDALINQKSTILYCYFQHDCKNSKILQTNIFWNQKRKATRI